MSVPTFGVAFGSYMVWAIADFYGPEPQDFYTLSILLAAIVLVLVAVYLIFFAVVGHKFVTRTFHILAMIVSSLLIVSAGYFVLVALF